MIVYENTLGNFIASCNSGSLPLIIKDNAKLFGLGTGDSEFASREHSLPEIANALNDDEIDKNLDVAIEYKLPLTKKRVDFIIYGDDENHKGNMIIVELKQWSAMVKRSNKLFQVRTVGGGSFGLEKNYLHPSYQSFLYKSILENFNEFIQNEKVNIEACSYLHNLDKVNEFVLNDETRYPFITNAPIFYRGDKDKLATFVKKHVKYGNKKLLYEIENSRIRPSKDFAKMMEDALKGNAMFTLDENQLIAVSTIVDQTLNAIENVKRKTIIIKGGPGCGKSVVALNTLGQLLNNNSKPINACYTTPNFTPGQTFKEDLINKNYKKVAISNLIKKFPSFARADEMEFDCIIVDEAHRAFTWRFGNGLPKNVDSIERIFHASKVVVFFIDEDQIVSKHDSLTVEKIKKYAKLYNSEVIENDDLVLSSQFRCLGGEDYINFINRLLSYNNEEPIKIKSTNRYEFKVFDSPLNMWEAIKEKQSKYKRSRLLSGYTHEWVSKNDDSQYDFIFDGGEFKMRWNLNGSPNSYINDEDQSDRIGCVHTVQGVDMEYAGVIIGKDIIYRNGKIIFDKTQNAKSDTMSGIRTASDEEATLRIKNTYKVLLTRAIYGTFIYCEDKELNEFIKSLIV